MSTIRNKKSFEFENKTYTISEPVLTDLNQFIAEMSALVFKNAAICAKAVVDVDPEYAREIKDKALRYVDTIKVGSDSFDEQVMTVDGMMYLSFLMLRDNHPDMNLSTVRKFIDKYPEFLKMVIDIAGFKKTEITDTSNSESDPNAIAPQK